MDSSNNRTVFEHEETDNLMLNGSPNTRKRILEHKFNMEDEQMKNVWESMCLKMDRRAVQYFCQIIIIASTMIFASYQLIHLTDCDPQQAYLGLLTLLIGLLLPNPKFHEKSSSEN